MSARTTLPEPLAVDSIRIDPGDPLGSKANNVTRAGLDRMNGQPDIADIDLGVFGPAVASWSRSIANAGEDIRPQVFRNCAAEGAGFVRKGADRGDIVAALIERAERHGLTVELGGIEGVEATIAAALEAEVIAASVKLINLDDHRQVPAPAASVRQFKLINIADIVISDDPLWLIDELVPAGPSMGVIFGKPKSGKSFLAASMMYHVAMGREYCGRAVQAGAVVYITNEGIRGFQRRLIVMREHFNVAAVPFFVVHTMPYMGTACGDAERLAEMIAAAMPHGVPVAAVVIDTLARAMSGKNENATEDMSVFLDNCDAIARKLVCFVAAVHHSPRGDDTRARGSNVLDGGADVIISVVKDKPTGVSTATVEEMKDGEAGLSWRFHLVQIELAEAEGHGKPGAQHFRCCGPLVATISNPSRIDPAATLAQQKLPASQRRFMDLLAEAIVDLGAIVAGSTVVPFNVKAVTREQLKKCLEIRGFLDTAKAHSARTIFGRTINDLSGKHLIGSTADHVWLPKVS